MMDMSFGNEIEANGNAELMNGYENHRDDNNDGIEEAQISSENQSKRNSTSEEEDT